MESHGAHEHIPRGDHRRVLRVTLALTLAFLFAEVAGAVLTNSLALLADAGHILSDAASLGLALFSLWVASRPRTPYRSFGYHRVEVLAALGNGVALWGVAGYILYQAAGRLADAPEVHAAPMLIIAVLGLLVNLAGMALLHRGAEESLNLKGAFLHVLGDALGSVGAIIAAALMLLFGWFIADPIISIAIAALILWSSRSLVWQAVHILLEGTPHGIDLADLEQTIAGAGGVAQVHDLHAWTLTTGYNAMSAHVVVTDSLSAAGRDALLDRLRHLVPERFPIHHVTIQMEESSHCCDVAHLPVAHAR